MNVAELIVDRPDAGLFRVHRSAMSSPELFALERERIFDRCWLYVAHESELPRPGDYRRRTVAGRPLFIVRGGDGQVRVLLDTCTHRGAMICRRDEGIAEVFQCFYHAWTFNNRGELIGTPDPDGYPPGFDLGPGGFGTPDDGEALESCQLGYRATEVEWSDVSWVALFTDDARYVVPTTDLPDGDPRRDLVLIDDDLTRLRGRVERLKSRHAHREYSWSRTRRLIANVRVKPIADDEVEVRASFVVYRIRGEMAPFVGRYEYRLVPTDDSFRIRYRRAVLDLEALREHGSISIIL